MRYSGDHFPGIGRYSVRLAHALAALDHKHTLVLLVHPQSAPSRYCLDDLLGKPQVEFAPVRSAPFSPLQQIEVPRRARALALDLLHSPYVVKPYVGLPCPTLTTIYDLLGRRFPQLLAPRGRFFYRLALGLALRTSAALLTISAHARAELLHYYRLPHTPITVTPLAADASFTPQPAARVAAVRSRYDLPETYGLYLGSHKPHKNLVRLVQAWAQAETGGATLVLAGHHDPQYPQVAQMVAEHGLAARVRFLPNVADADLPGLYSGATLFAFVSYYEGFGLPPLEALACGVPVLCANTTSLPEVVGDAALLVNPYRVADIAAGLTRLLADPGLRADLRARGLARAKTFSWQRTAQATLRLYEQLA